MATFRVLRLLPGESLDAIRISKTAPLMAAGVGYESNSMGGGLATVNARSAGTPRAVTPEREALMRKMDLKGYNPETEELEDGEVMVPGGFMTWSPAQWAVFFVALAAFIASVVNAVSGNPAGIPFAG